MKKKKKKVKYVYKRGIDAGIYEPTLYFGAEGFKKWTEFWEKEFEKRVMGYDPNKNKS